MKMLHLDYNIKKEKKPCLLYNKAEEIAWVNKFLAQAGITTAGFGSCHLDGKKEKHQNKRLVEITGADFFAKIRAQHGDVIQIVTKAKDEYYDCDALIFDILSFKKKPVLISNTTDCPTIAIVSQDKTIFALVHSGWKGCRLNIVGKTIAKIVKKYKIPAHQLEAFIWPGVCKKEYVVGKEFIEYFPKWVKNNRFDMKGLINEQLLTAGLMQSQIISTNQCSYHSLIETEHSFNDSIYSEKNYLFYSHRRTHNEFNALAHPLSYELEELQKYMKKKQNCFFIAPF